jgi:hypothetical protein
VIVINQNYGQLGNRLFLYAHFLAYGIENNRKVIYPGFSERLESFPNLKKMSIKNKFFGNICSKSLDNFIYIFFRRFFHAYSKPMRSLEHLTGRSFHIRLDPLQESFYPEFGMGLKVPNGLCFFEGWAFRVHEAFRKHAEMIRTIFQFDNSTLEVAQHFLKNFYDGLKVGIHVRRGDYASAAPQWVYSNRYWIEAISRIQSNTDQKIYFIIVSDDSALKIDIDGVHRFYGNDIHDMALLSKCDFVMGPPSTFNRWAAFVGDKPHFCSWNAGEIPTLDCFQKFQMASLNPLDLSKREIEIVRWFGII